MPDAKEPDLLFLVSASESLPRRGGVHYSFRIVRGHLACPTADFDPSVERIKRSENPNGRQQLPSLEFQGCQSSSGVEQRTHKPLVGGSNPSSGTTLKA